MYFLFCKTYILCKPSRISHSKLIKIIQCRFTFIFFYGKNSKAMMDGAYDNYWTSTVTYESLKGYISLNFDDLRDSVVWMLAGGRCQVNTDTFRTMKREASCLHPTKYPGKALSVPQSHTSESRTPFPGSRFYRTGSKESL